MVVMIEEAAHPVATLCTCAIEEKENEILGSHSCHGMHKGESVATLTGSARKKVWEAESGLQYMVASASFLSSQSNCARWIGDE